MNKRGLNANKRGLNEVVTMGLLVLLGIAGVIIIWGFFKVFLTDTGERIDTSVFSASFTIPAESVKIDEGIKYVSFVVKRNAGEVDLSGLKIILEDSSGVSAVYDEPALEELGSREIGISYANSSLSGLAKIGVAPVVVGGGGQAVTGNVLESMAISQERNYPLPDSSLTGLVGYWSFDDVSGNVVRDESGRGNDGVANNFDDPTASMLASTFGSFSASNAIDNSIITNSWQTNSDSPGGNLLIDLGVGNEKDYIKARLYLSSAGEQYNGIYDIQYSDDNTNFLTAYSGFAPTSLGNWNEVSWNNVGEHRYWRFLLTNTPGGGSYIRELELYTDNVETVAGKVGRAFRFDGVDDYIRAPNNPSFYFGTSDFSIGLWFDSPSAITTAGSNFPFIDSSGLGADNAGGFTLDLNRLAGTIRFLVDGPSAANDPAPDQFWVISAQSYTDGQWRNLVAIRNSSGSGELILYVDGQRVTASSGRNNAGSPNVNVNTNSDLFVGHINVISNSYYFNGSIDEVRIYSRALNADEIRALYAQGQ